MEKPDKVLSLDNARSRVESGETVSKINPSGAILDALTERARELLLGQLKRLFGRVDDSLFAMAERAHGQAEQDGLFQALRLLRVERRNITRRFDENLSDTFSLKDIGPPEREADSRSGLSLVHNDELEQLVAVDTMVNNASREFSPIISELCLRFDTLYKSKVYEKNLPIGPLALCDAFVAAIWPLDIHIRARLTLLKKFELEVMQQLGPLYENCNRLLVERGVLPDLQQRRQVKKEQGAVPDSPRERQSTETGSSQVGTATLGSATAPGLRPGLVPAGSGLAPMPVPDLLAHLGVLQELVPGQENAELKPLDVAALLQQRLQDADQAASLAKADKDVIKLMEMLFSFIVEDRNLAAPVKSLLSRLQLPLLKVAIADRTFFSKAGHPARKLLNEMADAATGWHPSSDVEDDPLYREMRAVVERVTAEFDEDVGLFEALLDQFRSFVRNQRRRAQVLEQRIVDEADGRARAEAARARVEAVMEALTDGRDLPPVVSDWLEKVWRRTLFLTCVNLGPDSEAWSNEVRTVRDLVWSVQVPMPDYARQLQALLPSLQGRLRDRVQAISLNPFEARRLFAGLKEIYRYKVDTARAAIERREHPPGPEPLQGSDTGNAGDNPTEAPAGTEGRDNLPQVEELEQVAAAADPVEARICDDEMPALPEDDPHWMQTFRLSQGSWFELHRSEEEQLRCRLAAVIRDIEQFIFVNRNGAKIAQFTRLELAYALRRSQLIPMDDGMLFERALQSVIGSGRRKRDEHA
ncbi:DUF1631 domain-containing protein [Microbulbifer sediminum]|uniref:DUF1631 domain-containing protein n=1 Tax=Microbulbifer sediminum TaxID=2904250 RepID=UPI001F318F7C|nr:DUF1631 domain-containing protein [Microbulbifer sediminum]